MARYRRRASSRPAAGRSWVERKRALILAIVAGALIIGLIAINVIPQVTGSRDFEFTLYRGHEIPGLTAGDAQFSDVVALGKPVVLNFYGGNCPPCRAEMPGIESVHRLYEDDVIILGLDVGPYLNLGSRQQGESLLRELGITYPAAYARNAAPIRTFAVTGLPQTVFIGKDGTTVRTWPGAITAVQLERVIRNDLGVGG